MTRLDKWIESNLAGPSFDPAAWVTEVHRFGRQELRMARPREPDRLLDDPAVLAESRSRDYMPYWAYIWPGALLLADFIAKSQWPRDRESLEIGCGLGLAGLAALAAGLHVTFSDYSPAALSLAVHNARLNGFDRFETRLVDWQCPPNASFQLVFGADVLYEARCVGDVLRVLDSMLAPHGEACLADPDRTVADEFPIQAADRGYTVDVVPIRAMVEADRVLTGRLFRVSRKPHAKA